MNKFINILLLLITFPMMLLAIFIGDDLPIEFMKTSGAQLPYRFEIFLAFGIIYYVIIVRRSVKRWAGVHMVSQVDRFTWNEPMGEERKKQVYLYQTLEALLMLFGGFAIYALCKEAWVPATALGFGAIDNMVFLFAGKIKNSYRIGLTSKALVVADRDIKVLYLSGLRKVTIQQQTVFFDYIEDLQMTFPLTCIQDKDKTAFKNKLEAQLDRDKVFFSDSVKNL